MKSLAIFSIILISSLSQIHAKANFQPCNEKQTAAAANFCKKQYNESLGDTCQASDANENGQVTMIFTCHNNDNHLITMNPADPRFATLVDLEAVIKVSAQAVSGPVKGYMKDLEEQKLEDSKSLEIENKQVDQIESFEAK